MLTRLHGRFAPTTGAKVPKLDGRPEHYRDWRDRIRDRLIGGHHTWGRLLDLIEKERVQLKCYHLIATSKADGVNLDMVQLAD